jgi:hypothetical protein
MQPTLATRERAVVRSLAAYHRARLLAQAVIALNCSVVARSGASQSLNGRFVTLERARTRLRRTCADCFITLEWSLDRAGCDLHAPLLVRG